MIADDEDDVLEPGHETLGTRRNHLPEFINYDVKKYW